MLWNLRWAEHLYLAIWDQVLLEANFKQTLATNSLGKEFISNKLELWKQNPENIKVFDAK